MHIPSTLVRRVFFTHDIVDYLNTYLIMKSSCSDVVKLTKDCKPFKDFKHPKQSGDSEPSKSYKQFKRCMDFKGFYHSKHLKDSKPFRVFL